MVDVYYLGSRNIIVGEIGFATFRYGRKVLACTIGGGTGINLTITLFGTDSRYECEEGKEFQFVLIPCLIFMAQKKRGIDSHFAMFFSIKLQKPKVWKLRAKLRCWAWLVLVVELH